MPPISGISNPKIFCSQYRLAGKLNARIELHESISVNPCKWNHWIFDSICLPERCSILKLGCGPGQLWAENLDRILPGWKICISDLSAGMLNQVQVNLGEAATRFKFKQIDAQAIPFANGSCDILITNQMLYHLPDHNKLLSEIWRVLAADEYLYALTVDCWHLHDLCEILIQLSPVIQDWGMNPGKSFNLENGSEPLFALFLNVRLDCYDDALRATKVEPLIEYVCSGMVIVTSRKRDRFTRFMNKGFVRLGDEFCLTRDTGLSWSDPNDATREIYVQ